MDDEPIPTPTTVIDEEKASAREAVIWGLVKVDLGSLSSRAKRINLSVPDAILSKIDSYAEKSGASRSGFLAEAAIEYMARHAR